MTEIARELNRRVREVRAALTQECPRCTDDAICPDCGGIGREYVLDGKLLLTYADALPLGDTLPEERPCGRPQCKAGEVPLIKGNCDRCLGEGIASRHHVRTGKAKEGDECPDCKGSGVCPCCKGAAVLIPTDSMVWSSMSSVVLGLCVAAFEDDDLDDVRAALRWARPFVRRAIEEADGDPAGIFDEMVARGEQLQQQCAERVAQAALAGAKTTEQLVDESG